jgi:hypothetical protein
MPPRTLGKLIIPSQPVHETVGNGGGLCTFLCTLTHTAGNTAAFTAAGEVFDFVGGLLPITGGAQEFAGANGELQMLPFVGFLLWANSTQTES